MTALLPEVLKYAWKITAMNIIVSTKEIRWSRWYLYHVSFLHSSR